MSSKNRKKQRKEEVNRPAATGVTFKNVKIKPRSKGQRAMLRSIYNNDLTLCMGPAGSGKTHMSIGAAVDLFQRRKIEKIILTRPMVEASQYQHGNKSIMGYLPGDINNKMGPFLRPLMDELEIFLSPAAIKLMIANGSLEICPLAYVRGRNFKNTFVICDEAQNALDEELFALSTRMCEGSKMVMSGDPDQTDLPSFQAGALENFIEDLDGIENLGIIYLEVNDIQRIKLVKDIIERRKQVESMLSEPASLERVGYDERKSTGSTASTDAGSER